MKSLLSFALCSATSYGFFCIAAVAQKLIGEDHLINGVSVHINNAEPKGSKDQSHRGDGMQFQYGRGGGGGGDGMQFQYGRGGGGGGGGYSGRHYGHNSGGPNQFGNHPNNNPFPGAMASNSGGGGNFNKPGFDMMNPAVLAAALNSWNSMLNGVFMGSGGGGGGNSSGGGGRGWQGDGDIKKDGNSWKGDNKW